MAKHFKTITLAFLVFGLTGLAEAQLCTQWASPQFVANLDRDEIAESSGIAFSAFDSNRLYHVNDSGDGPFVYMTDLQGRSQGRLVIGGDSKAVFKPVDVEDLSVGKCGSASCLFIADTGDNQRVRKHISLVLAEEPTRSGSETLVPILAKLKITYPDGPQNTEAAVIHPNGDFFLLTKTEAVEDGPSFTGPGFSYGRFLGFVKSESFLEAFSAIFPFEIFNRAQATSVGREPVALAKLYRVSRDVIAAAIQDRAPNVEIKTEAERVGSLDFDRLTRSNEVNARIATGMAFSGTGERLLVLTYRNAFEFLIDPSWVHLGLTHGREWQARKDFFEVPVTAMAQQEAVTYVPGTERFFVTSEYRSGSKRLSGAMMSLSCETQALAHVIR